MARTHEQNSAEYYVSKNFLRSKGNGLVPLVLLSHGFEFSFPKQDCNQMDFLKTLPKEATAFWPKTGSLEICFSLYMTIFSDRLIPIKRGKLKSNKKNNTRKNNTFIHDVIQTRSKALQHLMGNQEPTNLPHLQNGPFLKHPDNSITECSTYFQLEMLST